MPKESVTIFLSTMHIGGAETVVANLCNGLADYYHIHLVVVSGDISYDLDRRVKVWKLYKINLMSGLLQKISVPIVAWRYYRLCKKAEIKASISFLPQANFINAFGKIFRAKYKIILSQRTNESQYLQMLNPAKRFVQHFFISHLYKRADIINANSMHALIDLQKKFGLRNAKSLIYNPITPIPKLNELPDVLIGLKDKFKLIYVANFRLEKNHLMLLEAISLLPFRSNVKLILVGQG